jgi:hypothetical protein
VSKDRVIDIEDWRKSRTTVQSSSRALLTFFDNKTLKRKPRNPFERRWLEARGAGSKFAEAPSAKGEKRYDIESFATYKLEDVGGDKFRITIEGPRRYKYLFAAKIGGLEITEAERSAWVDDEH